MRRKLKVSPGAGLQQDPPQCVSVWWTDGEKQWSSLSTVKGHGTVDSRARGGACCGRPALPPRPRVRSQVERPLRTMLHGYAEAGVGVCGSYYTSEHDMSLVGQLLGDSLAPSLIAHWQQHSVTRPCTSPRQCTGAGPGGMNMGVIFSSLPNESQESWPCLTCVAALDGLVWAELKRSPWWCR